jgi:hypothetical protein
MHENIIFIELKMSFSHGVSSGFKLVCMPFVIYLLHGDYLVFSDFTGPYKKTVPGVVIK